jgi:hypothetical protein
MIPVKIEDKIKPYFLLSPGCNMYIQPASSNPPIIRLPGRDMELFA